MLELVYRGGLNPLPSGISVRIRAGSPTSKYYSYILGIYLGDGHITKMSRTYRLRIFQDAKYPDLIDKCVKYLEKIFTNNKVNVSRWHAESCKVITIYSNEIPALFPQHGPGRKHNRKITLEDWQKEVVYKYPKGFVSGLLDSDGCKYKQTNTDFCVYQFTNISEDIKQIFCWACSLLGVKCRCAVGRKNVYIYKKKYRLILDSFYRTKS